jgi:hypothetical protein
VSISVIESVADAVRATRDLQALLEVRGDLSGALCLCKASGAFYTTSSEALIGILEALTQIRATSDLVENERQKLSMLEVGITELLDLR